MADTVNTGLLSLDLNNQIPAIGINYLTNYLSGYTNDLFGDSELGRGMGTLFSSGISSTGNTMYLNLIKGNTLMLGVGKNAAQSLAGAGVGLASNYIGKGINALGGNSKLSRGIGAGVSTGLGIYGGNLVSNLLGKTGGVNPYGAAMTIAGSALGAAMGPSKEYGGKYGNVTRTMDTIYDIATAASNFLPGGQVISGAMALNKGLSNIFGSTSGMTKQDAILGSAFMPAPVKWLNMANAKTTSTFNNQSWQNQEKADSFMGNAFGNLGDKFDLARKEAGKTYGTFSNKAYGKALSNINFANLAWDKIMNMSDLNELLKIRSLYMTSINNLRYAQEIGGAWLPIARGKLGMKIFNNGTTHDMAQRLLSGAALIDNKQMILSFLGGGTPKKRRPPLSRMGSYTPEELQLMDAYMREVLDKRKERQQKIEERLEKAGKVFDDARRATDLTQLSVNSLIKTGLEVLSGALEAAENLRQEKVEKLHEALKAIEATFMADLAVGAYPFLRRGFRWAFNKAGLLVKVPVQKTVLETSSIIKPTIKKEYVNSPKDITSDVGELIAEGSERSVYTSKSNPNIVYKIEDGNAALEDINNIKIRSELTDDVIAPESTIGYFKHKNGKYYRVTQLDKYKSFNPDNYNADLSPELNLEIINTLEKAGWKVEVTNGAARTASKNGKVLRNLEHYNWGRDSLGNLKLIDLDVVEDTRILASLESDYKGKPVILSVPKTIRKADSDVAKMNEYHAANVLEYNQSTGNNVTSIPFRTDYNGRLVKVLPNEEFNTVVRSKNTNAPSGSEENIGGMYSRKEDTVYLRNTGNPSTNYHEFLHSSLYGETNPEVTLWRILQLIDEDKVSKMTPKQKAYYISETETPVHLRLQGERMNIEVGDPYPGDEVFDKMINEHGIGGAAYYMKRDTSKAKQLLWKAFNGTLFSGLTAVTLYSNYNK